EDGDPVLCDGLDNDCDGLTDEEISAGPTDADYDLILEAAGCLHQGVCQDQVHAACNPDASGPADRWDCDYGVVEGFGGVVLNGTLWENLCDGLDNDCDGATDENLGQDFGGAQSPKVLSGCRFSGICQGTMLWGCAAGKWTCQGPTAMGWEVTEASCDGVDNDCDGLTDQGLSNPSSCPGFGKGVCTAGISAPCQNAQWACSYAAVTGYEAVEATCDGKDNDCDNATDEGLAWTTSPGNNACKSKGVCHPEDVVAVCTGTVSGWTCNYDAVDDYTPSEGLGFCDGLDNDCDGTKDEQACGPCMGCTGNADCYSGLCYPDPFGSRRFCSTATKSCVQEDPATGQCKSVADSQVACISEAGRAICVSGQWNDPSVSDCSGATPVCYGGVCKKCLPQALACNGNQVLQCDGNGNNLYPIDTCAAGKICVGAGQCITNNEFQVDVLTAGALTFAPKPRVAALKGGGFVVAWGSANPTADGSGSAVQARLFNAAFQPAGQPFLVNDNLDNDQSLPSVAAFPTGFGRFVVAWTTVDSPGDSGQGVVARIFEKDGTPVTDEIPVNQTKALDQANPSVTLFADGSFLVAWDTKLQDNTYDVDARYFLADGTPDGDEFTLTTFQDFNQRTPDLASLPDGGVAASWTSTGKDSQGFAVAALTLSPTGLVDLGELLVNDYEFGSQKNQVVVSLAGDKAGWFGVVWESQKQAVGDSSGIYLELFDPDGIEVGAAADLLVHQNDLGAQAMPRAARLGDSDLVVVWQSDAVDGNGVGVARRIMGITGAPKTAELVVNQSVTGNQEDPDVDALDRAAFVVVWTNANNGHVMGRILNN
ncbi:MAG: hypothetical protein FJ098_09845, partial [Deltaproteobacteria bacterium]|nr:hypothetical protein [Deltaproteobacteria bacterium]